MVDLGHVAGDLGDKSSESAIAGDRVTANATAQVPNDVYARIMEGGVCLLGYHTWDDQSSASSFCASRGVPARPSRIH